MINVTIHWADRDEAFHRNRYSRAHDWIFDGGAVVPASSSPDIVPVPMPDPLGGRSRGSLRRVDCQLSPRFESIRHDQREGGERVMHGPAVTIGKAFQNDANRTPCKFL